VAVPRKLQDRYDRLLKRYALSTEEAYLEEAYRLGQELVATQCHIADIGEMHVRAIERLAREYPESPIGEERGHVPLLEVVMALEMASRARSDWLEEREKALEREIAERVRAEEKLQAYSVRLEEMVEERTRELVDAQEQLVRREKLATLGQLAGGVAHELRNPLGVINSAVYYLNVVLSDADETIIEYLEMISQQVRHATKIVSDLLDFARIRLARREDVSLATLIERTLGKQPPPEGVQVTTEIPPGLPTVFVDPEQMEQVLVNLVRNAYDAMPDGGRLTIAAKRVTGPSIRIQISDSGCGIAEENMDRLFEPLFTTKVRGIGLGLTVSKSLVEANGGSIEAESDGVPGKGSTFTVHLPLANAKT